MTLANQYKNNAAGKLLAGITAVSTSCTLQSGQGTNFPTANGTSTQFKITLVKDTGEREICVCKRTAGSDVITFIDVTTGAASVNGRAQEGTTALVFSANDQVELRLTAAQIQSFEDDIDTLQSSVSTISGDYLTSDHLPGGANEDDHDARYYQESELWSRTELAAAGGGAPIHAAHLTNLSSINHSDLTDDEATKHWVGDDTAGNGDTNKVWSADKIFDQLALKSATTHTHSYASIVYDFFQWNYGGYTAAGGGTTFEMNDALTGSSLTGSNQTFDNGKALTSIFLHTDITNFQIAIKLGAYARTMEWYLKIYEQSYVTTTALGTLIKTTATQSLSNNNSYTQIDLLSDTLTVSTTGFHIVEIWARTTDNSPGRYGIGPAQIAFYPATIN